MLELSKTTSSQLLGLKESAGSFLEEFSKPINDQLGPLLERASNWVKSLIPAAQAAGEYVVAAFKVISQVFEAGNLPDLALTGLKYAFAESVNFLVRLLTAGFAAAMRYLLEQMKNAVAMVSIITTADFWKGMGFALLGIAAQFGNKLMEFIAGLIEKLDFLPGIGDKMKSAASGMRAFAQTNSIAATDVTVSGMELLQPSFEMYAARLKETAQQTAATFTEALKDTADVFDTSEGKAALAGIGERISAIAGPVIAERMKKLELPNITAKNQIDEGGDQKNRPKASRLVSIGGLGVFVKDPLLTENRRQSQLLEKIAKNTENKKNETTSTPGLTDLVFS